MFFNIFLERWSKSVINIAIVYHSAFGHTKKQAEAIAEGVRELEGTRTHLISVDDVDDHWLDLERADAIIFGTPTYMGSVSAKFKTFMDASSKIWFAQGWKDKIAAGFTNSSSQSGDKLNTLISLAIFAGQHNMIWVGTGMMPGNNSSTGSINDLNRLGSFMGAMAQSNFDEGPELTPPLSDLHTAFAFGKRVAEATKCWTLGKHAHS